MFYVLHTYTILSALKITSCDHHKNPLKLRPREVQENITIQSSSNHDPGIYNSCPTETRSQIEIYIFTFKVDFANP